MTVSDDTSEFGQGFTYCIGLFLKYAEWYHLDEELS